MNFFLVDRKQQCFQCHMSYECLSGICYGDFCVKSLGK